MGPSPRFLSVAWFGRFKTVPGWAVVVALANLAGILYGFYYYVPQLARTPVVLWLFVPDSPLAVLWAQLALLGYWLARWRGFSWERGGGVAAGALDALAFLGNLQVGAWTVYVLLAYAGAFDTFAMDVGTLLLVSHAGMALLALLFVEGILARARAAPAAQAAGAALAVAYYAAQDWLDYFGPDFMDRGCAMRPHTVPCDPHLEAVLATFTFALTALGAALLAAMLLVARRARAAEVTAR